MLRLLIFVLFAGPAFGADCGALAKMSLDHAKITAAQEIQGGFGGPTHCEVSATLTPTPDSDIKIELWMPVNWNGRYQAVGNGGWSGSINRGALTAGIRNGYAISATDTGHSGGSASFALGHPEKLIDYAYRSEHEMTVKSKAIIAAFYGEGPKHAYWTGCSAGGKQALMEAQRYPTDFDGIVAGSPAANWVGRATQSIWTAQAVHNNEASYIPPAKYPAIHRAVIAACDDLDGVADGVLESPRACKFDPKVIECKSGDSDDCLTTAQVEAARKIYGPSVNPRTKKSIYPGLEYGSELGWATWGGPKPLAIGLDYFRYVVFENPDWDFRTLDFDRDVTRAQDLDSHRINALDPDLRPFFAHGGKLIQYHGWNDPQIAPGNSVDYYESVLRKLGGHAKVDDSYRLFMVPGMAHCGGGEGPNQFDMLNALEQWVEQKTAPARIVASRPSRTRPLCPYPQVAVYTGTGSTDDEANFVCKQR